MFKRLLALAIVAVMAFTAVAPNVSTAQGGPSGQFEIFSWWAGADGGPAIEALIALYSEQNPDVEVVNAVVTGGSGVNANAVLKTRMLGGTPPDTFQVHAGQQLVGTWVIANRMEDLTSLYEEEGLFDAFPADLIDLLSYEGGIYSVPLNIHRSNVMWFNPAKLEEWGVTAPATWDDFFAVCPTLQEAGVTPLVVGQAWTLNHLWESVALATLGVDNWNALWAGELDPAGAEMMGVWDNFGKVLDCSNVDEDASTLTWEQATDRIVSGEAAFNIMGDWAAGYMATSLGLEPGTDFGYAPAPGTSGTFMMLSDSFGLPTNSPNPDAAVAWLKVVGSKEGQDAFNSLKGSIPARVDGDVTNAELYNAYQQSAAADWASNTIVGSLVHGVAANERFMNDFNSVMEVYLSSHDSTAAANAMSAVCATSGACGQ